MFNMDFTLLQLRFWSLVEWAINIYFVIINYLNGIVSLSNNSEILSVFPL